MKSTLKAIPFALIIIISILTVQAHKKEKHAKPLDDSVKTQMTDHNVNKQNVYKMEKLHMNVTKKEKASLNTFPTLHPLIVHFPIVLLLLSLLTQFAGLFVFRKELNWITLLLVFGGLIGAYVAAQLVHPHTTGLTETATWVLENHERYADYTLWTALSAFLLKAVSMFLLKKKVWMEVIILVVLAASAYSVSEASHYGAQLLHIEGVGSQGNYLEQPDTKSNHSDNH